MIKIGDKKWNLLRLACSNPTAVLHELQDLCDKILGKRLSHRERIATQQKRTYGEPVYLSKKEVDDYIYTSADEKRIQYYLGNIGKMKISLDRNNRKFTHDAKPRHLRIEEYETIRQAFHKNRIKEGYTLPLLNLFELLPDEYKQKQFLYKPGDNMPPGISEGVIAKTRNIEDRSVTLLKLNPERHWGEIRKVKSLDTEYRQKKDMAIWRGATTGDRKINGKRIDLVNRFFDHQHKFDVGFSIVLYENDSRFHLVKDIKTIKAQLRYKFLICIEGNDVASGLKWMLQSNSVVMMPRPTASSWLMEDTLEPFVHYIPLADDFSDAEELFDWAVSHEAECIEISNNASRFLSQFFDSRREVLLECEVLKRYLDNLIFTD